MDPSPTNPCLQHMTMTGFMCRHGGSNTTLCEQTTLSFYIKDAFNKCFNQYSVRGVCILMVLLIFIFICFNVQTLICLLECGMWFDLMFSIDERRHLMFGHFLLFTNEITFPQWTTMSQWQHVSGGQSTFL